MQKGDKVKILVTTGGNENRIPAGTTGFISHINDKLNIPIRVRFIDDEFRYYREKELEVISED